MYEDPENQFGSDFQFSEKSIRLGFIRKVYAILLVQLTITVGFIALCVFEPNTKGFMIRNPYIWWIAFAMTFILLIVLACCPNVRRNYPTNIILLGIFTLCEAVLLGAVSSVYDNTSVIIAVGVTALVALGLTIFSFQTKWDFTMMGGMLFVGVIVLFFFGLFTIIWPNDVLIILYASIGALLFSAYLVFDTQLMLGGKHKYSISPEEYIFAALNLYLDIINLFLMILTLVGAARD
ncbi:hypothetical protein CHUAL_010447 [Chamberlinius hualienensis]